MEHNKKTAVTASDVAKLAGVSMATVSRVYNKNWTGPMSEKSRNKVIAAAKELGYIPNAIAPILSSGRSNSVAIVVSEEYSSFFMEAFHLMSRILDKEGMRTLYFTCAPSNDVNDVLSHIMKYRVDGIIITSAALMHTLDTKWVNSDVPVVLYTGYTEGLDINAVQSDNYSACIKVADLLSGLNFRKIAYFNCENSKYSNHLVRQNAFLKGLAAHGIYDVTICSADYSYEGTLEVAMKFFATKPDVEAIFCGGNFTGLAVIDAARKFGYKIGENLSIVGFYSSGYYDLDSYNITCLKQDLSGMAVDAVNLLMNKIKNPNIQSKIITHPMTLCLGNTTPTCPDELKNNLKAVYLTK